MRGGYRTGAGRKKGFAAIKAEKAREYFAEQVGASLEPIVATLVKKATRGDIRAIQVLFERAYGRAPQAKEDVLTQPFVIQLMTYDKTDSMAKQQEVVKQ